MRPAQILDLTDPRSGLDERLREDCRSARLLREPDPTSRIRIFTAAAAMRSNLIMTMSANVAVAAGGGSASASDPVLGDLC